MAPVADREAARNLLLTGAPESSSKVTPLSAVTPQSDKAPGTPSQALPVEYNL